MQARPLENEDGFDEYGTPWVVRTRLRAANFRRGYGAGVASTDNAELYLVKRLIMCYISSRRECVELLHVETKVSPGVYPSLSLPSSLGKFHDSVTVYLSCL
jgi:hypothetical protein